MKECPRCGHSYPETYLFCPADGSPLNGEEPGDAKRVSRREPAQIRVRTLMLGFAVLVVGFILAFTALFFYQYWKPKYGDLVVKTTPPGAAVWVDGRMQGTSPITIQGLRSGAHTVRGAKEGFKDVVQQVAIMPYSTENLHWTLEPIVPQLTNEQLAEVEALRRKLENARKENILLPPPEDYNVLFFADRILSIDPANSYAMEAKAKLAETFRRLAESAYAREDWLESEKQYKNLALVYPNDPSIEERLADVAVKLDESVKDREKQIQEWMTKAEAAIKVGSLLPPERDNAYDAIRNIQRLDKNNLYARQAIAHLKELLQNRGDTKIAASDWNGARNDFRLLLQYFPEDSYSKARMAFLESKIAEAAQLEQQKLLQNAEEQQSRQKVSALRQTAINSYRAGLYQKSISEWQEYLKLEPNSDEAYFYLGANYQDMKQLDSAILQFEKCLSINPNHTLAHLNLGLLYDYHRGNLKQAEEHLQKAKDLGGAERYGPERIQALIQDLRDRAQANTVVRTPFAVEHRHAFSSCRGNLHLSDEGIEYRTGETDHSFYESYKDLRSLVLEGVELSLRTRNNKRYNFRFLNPADAARVRAWGLSTGRIEAGGRPE